MLLEKSITMSNTIKYDAQKSQKTRILTRDDIKKLASFPDYYSHKV